MGTTGDMENFMKSMATPAPGKAASTLSPGTNKPKQENIIRVANCFPTDITVDVQEMKVSHCLVVCVCASGRDHCGFLSG